jgi:hypothetical protein
LQFSQEGGMQKKRDYPVARQTRKEIETITSHYYENPANITYTPDEINDVLITIYPRANI